MYTSERHSLTPDLLVMAYRKGLFPMAESREGALAWFSPDPRAIIPLERFRISRSLRRVVQKGTFTVRMDSAFEQVMRACAEREETWISEEIIEAYTALHTLGFAHSVECWQGDQLAGGLYGVAIGAAFFGESMFSRTRDASKVALVHLVVRLRARGYLLLDTQFFTPHLERFGAMEIPRSRYMALLTEAVTAVTHFSGPPIAMSHEVRE
jgi:leucyl/phenylalanyl-tRNA---protein transferase